MESQRNRITSGSDVKGVGQGQDDPGRGSFRHGGPGKRLRAENCMVRRGQTNTVLGRKNAGGGSCAS